MTSFWKSWMTVWCWATLALGALFAAAAVPALDGGARLFYDVVTWPIEGYAFVGEGMRFTVAILGAVMIGWALTIFAMVRAAEALGAPAWRGLTFALVAWYIIDSTISVMSGIPGNAVTNTLFVAGYLAPVLASGVLRGERVALA